MCDVIMERMSGLWWAILKMIQPLRPGERTVAHSTQRESWWAISKMIQPPRPGEPTVAHSTQKEMA